MIIIKALEVAISIILISMAVALAIGVIKNVLKEDNND